MVSLDPLMSFSCSSSSSACLFTAPSFLSFSGVLETVASGLFDPNALEPRLGELSQTRKNLHTEIFRGRHPFPERGNLLIQIPAVECLDHFALHEAIEVRQIRDHTGRRIHISGNAHLDHVVVAVPLRVVAFSVAAFILVLRYMLAVEPMTRGKAVASRQL